jgi:hypothetical protein
MDNSVTNETETSVIVMQDTVNHLLHTKQMDYLNKLMSGTWDRKTMYVNEDKDAMEQTGDEITYYKQTTDNNNK